MNLDACIKTLQYGTSAPANPNGEGLPVLRMNNLQDSGWDLTDLKYIELPPNEAEAYRLRPGDILFNRTNSKELVGKCAVFCEEGHWVFASYLIRMVLDEREALPSFVASFLDARAGRAQIDRVSRQIIGMSNINAEEIRKLKVPLPSVDTQFALAETMKTAQETRRRKLAEADSLLASFDEYLLERLGLAPLAEEDRASFAVRLGQVKGRRIDPSAYLPFYAEGDPPKTPTKSLREISYINANKVQKPVDSDMLVPYVGLPECSLTEVCEVTVRRYEQVKGQSVLKRGDILFARIEPSVFNKKYVLADNLFGHDHAYTSTEFGCVRKLL